MVYVKVLLLAIGLWALSVKAWPLPLASAALVWLLALIALQCVLRYAGGHALARRVWRFALFAAAVWSLGAATIGVLTGMTGHEVVVYVADAGLVRAVRFACAFSWSAMLVAWIQPSEVYGITWLPRGARAFILVFRVLVSRSMIIITEVMDGLHGIGLPHGRALSRSLIIREAAFPSHGLWRESIPTRAGIVARSYLGVVLAYFELLIADELPEVDAVYNTLQER